ncbi:hypothetical protein EOPP23_12885 [Endozoicomonas sp. OPT23]|nr:hypothetical protein [Endozoicomonas sp. OPT23]
MVFSIPLQQSMLTVLVSPYLGVFASLSSEAISEYLYRTLAYLITNRITQQVRIYSARQLNLGWRALHGAGSLVQSLCMAVRRLCFSGNDSDHSAEETDSDKPAIEGSKKND